MEKTFKITQVQKKKIYKDIIQQIKNLILRGQINEGDRLPAERELAEQFGVSRVSVRQALTVLHEMGLVESRHGGGTYVSYGAAEKLLTSWPDSLSVEKGLLHEPLEVRRIIEPEVTRLAALRAGPKDVAKLTRLISLQKAKARKGAPITEEDTIFHEAIVTLTRNSLLIKLVKFVHVLLRASRHQSLIVEGGNQRSIEDHLKILDAISRKNPEDAYQAMVVHLRNVEGLISRALRKKRPTTI